MFKLIRATAVVSIATIITIIVGLVRAKFTAVTLGPAGVGIFSHALNFQQLFVTVSTLGIGVGVTRYVSRYNSQNNAAAIEGIISCAFWMQIIASSLSVAVIFILGDALSKILFATGDYAIPLFVSAIGIPFFVIAVTSETILLGFGNYKAFTKAKGLSSILALAPLFLFIYAMKVRGAFIYLAVSGIITFCVYHFLLYKNMPKGVTVNIFNAKGIASFRQGVKGFAKDLLSYGGVTFITGVLSMINVVFLRSLVIRYFGAAASGLYQVVFTMSAYYLMFFTNGLWAYFYPKLSAITDARRFSVEINYAIRFCVFGVVTFITTLFLFRFLFINVVFSEAFTGSSDLFAAQLFGDFFFIQFYIVGTFLLARARLKEYLLFGVLYSVVLVGSFLLLKDFAGLGSITISFLVTNVILFAAAISYYLRIKLFVLYGRNVRLILSAITLLITILFLGGDNLPAGLVKIAFLAIWLYLLSTRAERARFMKFTNDRAKGIFGYGR